MRRYAGTGGSARGLLARRREPGSRAPSPGPTPAQQLGWPAIAAGGDVLIQAPTGSGKTLPPSSPRSTGSARARASGLRVLYVSPLKALNYDIERNLRGPLAGLGSSAAGRRPHRRHPGRASAAR